MTWGRNPTINKEHMTGFEKETNSIVQEMKKFERENNIPVIPCGLIFYDLIADPPSGFSLRVDWPFMVENIHQNHLGTMANVAAHYAILVGRSPIGLPMWDPYPKKLVKKLQKRVWQLVQEWKHEKLSVQ